MKQFSLTMALVDYIPVVFFCLASLILIKDLHKKMSKASLYVYVAGAFLVTAAGFLKASYKLLYALQIGDFLWMSGQFFSNQSLGFLLAGVGLMMYVMSKNERAYGFLPTMALVGIMVVGLGAMDAALCSIANKMKKRNALICFIVSFFFCLMMGYLSSKDFDKVFMNWAAQFINIGGQGLFYLGVRILHEAGL
ncbi:MAG: hypothetical protein K5648_05475 [Erysipelotrichaceae bacterium]|nr:hypothetical protein [Erysipelotrichaceae bacterium]